MCTYYSKGVADYVGIWDFNEFFIPRGDHKNLLDVIKATTSINTRPVQDQLSDGLNNRPLRFLQLR